MSIQYALYPNSFHRRKPKAGYVARVHHTTTCDQKMLVELIASRNGALSPALVGSVLEEYAATLEYALASGMRVSIPALKMQAKGYHEYPYCVIGVRLRQGTDLLGMGDGHDG